MTILAVTGLKKEARIVGAADVVAVAGGGDSAGLAEKLNALHGDIRGVISIGLGGGLSTLVKVGDVVVGEAVSFDGPLGRGSHVWPCDETWRVRLMGRLSQGRGLRVHQGVLAASDVVLGDAGVKAGLHARTGALAVDMESHVAARFAAARGFPFATLRVISDDATHALPPAAGVAMKPDGSVALGAVLWSLMKNPAQLPALVRTGQGASKAFRELLRCRDLLGVRLAGPHL
jgi:hopanoid-associated phosphorylase